MKKHKLVLYAVACSLIGAFCVRYALEKKRRNDEEDFWSDWPDWMRKAIEEAMQAAADTCANC